MKLRLLSTPNPLVKVLRNILSAEIDYRHAPPWFTFID